MRPKPVVLIILDGVGVAFDSNGNCLSRANTPFLESVWNNSIRGYLKASEEAVGLPAATKGNSEVGHMNLGAGKVVYQSLLRIDKSIQVGAFAANTTLLSAIKNTNENNKKLHIIGLVSDGGTHSHINHMLEILKVCAANGCKNICIHAFTDGRDAEPKSAMKYLNMVATKCAELGVGRIVSLIGRYYAMDRDNRWDRIQKAYDLLTLGVGKKMINYKLALEDGYTSATSDEFMPAYLLDESGKIENGDSVIFVNFRADRATQLTEAFVSPIFSGFPRGVVLQNLFFGTMMTYGKALEAYTKLIFPRNSVSLPIGRVISEYGFTQLRIAESEKYPHVTYFFNGGQNLIYTGEERIEVPSPRDVATYDQKPEMSAVEMTDVLIPKVESGKYDFVVVNYANGDMVGHTGVVPASIKAVETLDACVQRLVKSVISMNGVCVITADHGNVEEVISLKTGDMDTEHSINPVPVMIVGKCEPIDKLGPRVVPMGKLADIGPSILTLMELNIPSDMEGHVIWQ